MANDSKSTLLTPDETADLLRMNTGTLAVWRCTGRYDLPFIKAGRRVRYRQADVERFLESRTVNPGV